VKIVHLDPDDMGSPTSGGGPIRTFEIYRRLAKRHEITVLTPSFPGAKKEEVKEGIRYVRLGRKYGNHDSTYFISFYFEAPFAVRRFEHDLLVEDLMPPTAATLTPVFNRKKIVASVQWFFAKDWAKQYKIPFHWYQPFGLKLYKNFIVLTEDMEKEILKYNSKANITVIPNGLNNDFFEAVPTSEDFILYLGRIDHQQKGVDLLLEAFQKISGKTNVNLVIAGDGMDLEKTKSEVRRLNLESRVIFTGKVGMEKKKELLSKCRFVAVPSRYETFCMVALEAFASAKPVVAFNIPFLDVVKDEFSIRVEAFNVERYAQGMLRFLSEPEVTKGMGEKAREYARSLSWDELARAQEEFYLKVLGKN